MARVSATIAVLMVAALVGWLAWSYSNTPGTPDVVDSQPAADKPERVASRFYTLPSGHDWAWSDADGLVAEPKTPEKPRPTMPAVRVTRVHVKPPVNVDFTDMDLTYPEPTTPTGPATPEADVETRQARTNRQLNPNIDELRQRSDDDELFNKNTGLRGFMTQSWINDNVGLQGGLAIPTERTRNENQSLSDQMAVGMGVLFAF